VYWIWRNEESIGPYEHKQVLKEARPDDFVSNGDQWVLFDKHPDFSRPLPPAPPQPGVPSPPRGKSQKKKVEPKTVNYQPKGSQKSNYTSKMSASDFVEQFGEGFNLGDFEQNEVREKLMPYVEANELTCMIESLMRKAVLIDWLFLETKPCVAAEMREAILSSVTDIIADATGLSREESLEQVHARFESYRPIFTENPASDVVSKAWHFCCSLLGEKKVGADKFLLKKTAIWTAAATERNLLKRYATELSEISILTDEGTTETDSGRARAFVVALGGGSLSKPSSGCLVLIGFLGAVGTAMHAICDILIP